MHLICANETVDCTGFRPSLDTLFALLPLRKDKACLKKLINENPVHQKLDEDTVKTASILMGVKLFMEDKEKYKNEEGYDMCKANEKDICPAIREMMEDSRAEGWEAGRIQGEKAGWIQGEKAGWKTGIHIFIQSNRDDGIEDTIIVDKLQKYYDLPHKEAQEFLRNFSA